MNNRDLSVIIVARNEMFLAKTVAEVHEKKRANTEVIVVCDVALPDPPLPAHPDSTFIFNHEPVGQRAATNMAVKISNAKYVMKLDAHCALDEGFDIKMMAEMHDDWTMVPLMRNLHAFDWVCPNGHRRYQGPSGPCIECGKETQRDIVWIAKESPKSVSFCFDSTPHFQYFGEYSKRPEAQGDITETMSIQGSCFMVTRAKYLELGLCDENFGGWGSQGIEVACKTWLSGGRVVCNKKTWYAHMFRTQGGDFGFPYPMPASVPEHAKSYARNLFFNNNWPQQIHPLSWLVEKFWPVKGWTDEDLKNLKNQTFKFSDKNISKPAEVEPHEEGPTKGIIYYTDSQLDEKIARPVRNQLLKISQEKSIPIVSSSLQKIDFGIKNVHLPSLKRGIVTMFKQILAALEASTADIIFFCEHDVLYHPSHFDFVPPKPDVYYYNTNVWKVRLEDGHALWVDDCKQLSGLCANRQFLITHYRKRLDIIKKRLKELKAARQPIKNEGVSRYMGYEPGLHSPPRGVDDFPVASWKSEYPNIDIRHTGNFTKSRWSKSQFVDQKYTKGWKETSADKIPGWENLLDRFRLSKGIIYYSDCQLDEKIAQPVRDQLLKISREKNIPIVSATLKKMDFGVKNIHFPSTRRGYLGMFKQIKAALEHQPAQVIFFCEHDVLYHPSHFDFVPADENTFYYNQNVWYLRTSDGHALHYDVNQLSGMCGGRVALLTHFTERYKMAEEKSKELSEPEFNKWVRHMGFEPMTHGRVKWQNKYKLGTWKSAYPNIDIRHPGNVTGQRWKKSQFRNQKLLKNWKKSDINHIPGWKKLKELIPNGQAVNR